MVKDQRIVRDKTLGFAKIPLAHDSQMRPIRDYLGPIIHYECLIESQARRPERLDPPPVAGIPNILVTRESGAEHQRFHGSLRPVLNVTCTRRRNCLLASAPSGVQQWAGNQ